MNILYSIQGLNQPLGEKQEMTYGYMGNILKIDLNNEEKTIEKPPESFYRKYFGGRGLMSLYLLKEMESGIDPLSPDNLLIFACGPVTGAPFSGSGRNSVGSKSPLTGGYGEAEAGGFWGAELKRAGFDAIVVRGKSNNPVYISIEDENVEIKGAEDLWGHEIKTVEERIKTDLQNDRARIAQIGPGGEKMVRYASIVNDLNHVAGRCGIGAVMGSKKLKAIAISGSQKVNIANDSQLREMAAWIARSIDSIAGNLHTYGTGSYMDVYEELGNLPVANWRGGRFSEVDSISAQAIKKNVSVGMGTCFACAVRCKKEVEVGDPWNVDPAYGGPEYETIGALGSNCGVSSLEAICKGNELCQKYCIDTISTGGAISFAMECFENGIITEVDTGGISLHFGNADGMLQMIDKIAKREGIGDILAEGVKRAAKHISEDSEEFAVHVKGQEVPLHEPRLKKGLGLGYAVSPTGADHQHNMHDTLFVEQIPEEFRAFGLQDPLPADDLSAAKVRLFVYTVSWYSLDNCLVTCQFPPWSVDQKVDIVRHVTGWNTSAFELAKVSERAINLARIFNIREGFTKDDDWLPPRFFTPHKSGPLSDDAIASEELHFAIETYYSMMGWDKQGVPSKAKLEELGIGWAANELA
ncbi:MAG: aldehyde ferredoxin oxidoreductase family protein [Promethearchaeia archaeon]